MCGQVAVSLVSAMAAAGFNVAAREGHGAAAVRSDAEGAWEWEEGEEGEEGTVRADSSDWQGWVGGERSWRERKAMAAGVVARGCVVMAAVSDLLYALVDRRAEELPSALPSVLNCLGVYLDWLMLLGTLLPLLRLPGDTDEARARDERCVNVCPCACECGLHGEPGQTCTRECAL